MCAVIAANCNCKYVVVCILKYLGILDISLTDLVPPRLLLDWPAWPTVNLALCNWASVEVFRRRLSNRPQCPLVEGRWGSAHIHQTLLIHAIKYPRVDIDR